MHSIDHLEARYREIIDSLRERIVATGIPKTRLSVEAGLSEMTLRRFEESTWTPSPKTIRKLETYLSALAEHRNIVRFVEDDCKGSKRATAQRPSEVAA